MSRALTCHGLILALLPLAISVAMAETSAQPYRSPNALAVTPAGDRLFVAEHTARQVAVVDLPSGGIAARIDLPDLPTGIALSPDGSRVYITAGVPEGRVLVHETASLQHAGTFEAGHSPTAPVISPDGTLLYVCNRFENEVLVLDAASGTLVARIPVSREPMAAALSPDGGKLVVANHLPEGSADGAYAAALVTIINTGDRSIAASVALPNGSNALKGVCLSPDGQFAYVTHILARYQLPTTQLERGWMNTNALSIIYLADNTLLTTVLLDNVDKGAANPWGVACTGDGRFLCVAHAGTHELSVIDRAALHAKIDRVAAGEQVSGVSKSIEDVPNDLAFLVDIRHRVALPGKGPRAVTTVGNAAYVAQYFTDNLAVVEVGPEGPPTARALSLGPDIPMTEVRLGELFAHDAELCFQQWQSCSSCHPDMRVDGLNWDLLNDGMGNPKNTKSLLMSHVTPPVMISGIRADAETAVRSGIKFIQFAVRPEEDARAIDAYLRALEPLPGPRPDDEAVRRGEAVFQKAGCATCHPGPLYTDMQKYNVGTGLDREVDWEYDTPTLVELWRTAPYLHDGRAATLGDVLGKHNPNDKHGRTSGLTGGELQDLVAYLLSL